MSKIVRDFEEREVATHLKKIDSIMIQRIEEIEGRVPSNEEISLHGNRGIYPYPMEKEEWRWKGKLILTVTGRIPFWEYHVS